MYINKIASCRGAKSQLGECRRDRLNIVSGSTGRSEEEEEEAISVLSERVQTKQSKTTPPVCCFFLQLYHITSYQEVSFNSFPYSFASSPFLTHSLPSFFPHSSLSPACSPPSPTISTDNLFPFCFFFSYEFLFDLAVHRPGQFVKTRGLRSNTVS